MIKKILILSILTISLAYRDNINCENTFTIDEAFFNEEIVGYYIAAFDLTTGVSNVLMFDYVVQSSGATEDCPNPYLPGDQIFLTIDFEVKLQIPEIGINSHEVLSRGEIEITNILGPVHFQNTDLNLSSQSIGSANIKVENFDIIEDDLNIDDISGLILQSGKIPNGSYMFDFKLKNSNDEVIDQETKTIEIYEPSFLELISPGGEISDTTETRIFSNYPVFSWNGDFCSSCAYSIRVSEYRPSEHSSLSEALNDISSLPLDQSQDFYQVNPVNSNVFQYPASNAADLQAGRLYAWQIKRSYQTTIGNNDIYSPIFIFKVISPDELANEGQNEIDILQLIKELIGESKYNQLFGPGGQLEGYFVYSMTLNGVEVNEEGLKPVVEDIANGKRKIIETKLSEE